MPGKAPREMTKRELVARLYELVSEWDGVDAVGRIREKEMRSILDVLDQTRLFTLERHTYVMCQLWLGEACRKPSARLRKKWLVALDDWTEYMEMNGFFADETR